MKPLFRLVVAGGREYNDFNHMVFELDRLLENKAKTHEIIIVSGTARGADRLGERYAKLRGYQIQYYPADWDQFPKAAGYIRNEIMAKNSDASAVFWDGKSRGSMHMMNLTETVGNPLRVVRYAPEVKIKPRKVTGI